MKDAIYCGLLVAVMLSVLIRDYYRARLERAFLTKLLGESKRSYQEACVADIELDRAASAARGEAYLVAADDFKDAFGIKDG